MKKTLPIAALAILAGVFLFMRPWQSSSPTPPPSSQPNTPDPNTLVTSPKSGKVHPLLDFKPAPGKPGWVICPDTNQQIPLASLKR